MKNLQIEGLIALDQSRYIQDALHGTIALTQVESDIVDHPLFQRLRSVKQLGNASFIFPSATHSRFSHSLGVMHQASALFSAVMRRSFSNIANKGSGRNAAPPSELARALRNTHQRVRLAGLLHDLGHGPFSHHFEHFIENSGLTFGKFKSTELKIPTDWIEKEDRKAFLESKLCHEHLSYGLIMQLQSDATECRALISLLDKRVTCPQGFQKDLRLIAKQLGCESAWKSLHTCLKSLLSSDIDADRMDYLRRDSYFCGLPVTLDTTHLLRSIGIVLCKQKSHFFVIELESNAVFAVEQLLLARKQMFDQVYQNRANQLLDELLAHALEEARSAGVLKVPTTAAEFLRLTDESVTLLLRQMITDTRVSGHQSRAGDLAIKMYITRTLPVTLDSRLVNLNSIELVQAELKATFPQGCFISFQQKELMKNESRGKNAEKPLMPTKLKAKPETDFPDGAVLCTRSGKNSPLIPVRDASELIRSSAWREPKCRVIVTESFYKSAIERGLGEKLKVWGFGHRLRDEKEIKESSHSRSAKPQSNSDTT